MNKKSRQKGAGKNKRYLKLIANAEEKLNSGHFSSAADLIEDALRIQPELPEAWHKLGATFYFMSDMPRASEAFERAVSLDSSNFNYVNDLGGIYLTQARFVDAERAFRSSIEIEPHSVEAQYNLATCLSEQGKFQDAIPILRTVISQSPDLPEAKFNLAIALRKIGKTGQAIPLLEQVVSDALPIARLELARCYRNLHNWAKAKAAYSKLPDGLIHEEVAEEFAEAIYLNGDTTEALAYLEMARQRFPKAPQRFELLMADIYLNSGELEQAKGLVEGLVAQGDGEYFLNAVNLLVRMQSGTELDESLRNKLLGRLALAEDNLEEQVGINFTVAKLYDNANAFREAETYYLEANRLKSQGIFYNETKQEAIVENIMNFFSQNESLVLETKLLRDSSEREITPVFIIGLPRSGTTLVEQVLAAHSLLSSAGELGFFSNTAFKIKEMFQSAMEYPDVLSSLSIEQLENLKRSYLSLLQRHSDAAPFVTDKMPENFTHVGFIRLLFPQAPIIHVRRELADIAISIFMQNFEQGNQYAFTMRDIAHYFVQYERLMAFWESLEDMNLSQVHYERIIAEPKLSSEELFGFLQLPWEARSLEFYRNKSDVRTASNWQVRQPLYESSVGRASNYPRLKSMFDEHISEQRKKYV